MQVLMSIVSAVLLILIIHFVVSPKSSRLLRLTALAALVLIAISIGVCAIILVRGPATEDAVTIALPFLPESSPQPEKKSDLPTIIVFFAFFLILAAMIYFSAKKEKQRNDKEMKEKEAANSRGFQASSPVPDENASNEEVSTDDETFDIGLD